MIMLSGSFIVPRFIAQLMNDFRVFDGVYAGFDVV